MANDYIRREDTKDALQEKVFHNLTDEFYGAMQVLDELEPADVVQVVRCRKCKYFWTYRCMDSMPIETCELAQTFYNPDIDFCSLAERREE